MFRVGQKVAYVGGECHPLHQMFWGHLKVGFVVGGIYTIREIDPIYIPYYGHPGIRVEEIVRPKLEWSFATTEPAVLSYMFRPIVEKQTDISFAHDILRKATKRERV